METNDRRAALQPLSCLVKDARSLFLGGSPYFSTLNIWFEKYIEPYVMNRGVELLLVDFPKVGKLFDKGLSTGVLDVNSLPCSFSPKGPIYRYLMMDAVRENGDVFVDDPDVVFFIRTILYLYKKVQIDSPKHYVKEKVDEFIDIEHDLKYPSGTWDNDKWIPFRFSFRTSPELLDFHPRARSIWSIADTIFSAIVPLSEVTLSDLSPKHGPGAVADLRTGEDKYSFPYWPNKLSHVFPSERFAYHSEDRMIIGFTKLGLSPVEPPARLIAVPKTYTGPRLIASEPTAHQFLQQALMRWIRQKMGPIGRTSINFKDQTPSRDAALRASLGDGMATVDLSSASDRLTCWVVERAFGVNQSLLEALHAVRTRHLIDATGTYSDMSIKLKKFAAQGSAVTFPVQSIVYLGLCLTALAFVEGYTPQSLAKRLRRTGPAWGPLRRLAERVRVFGDDLIVPRDCVPILNAMLRAVELKVNVSKTHTSGRFRESCGMDAFNGSDVTPCYLTSWHLETTTKTKRIKTKKGKTRRVKVRSYKPESLTSWVDVSNNAHRKGLWHLSDWMTNQISRGTRRLIATSNEDGGGIRLFTFCDGFVTESRVRWNSELHRDETLLLESSSHVSKERRGSWQDLHQWLVEAPRPEDKWTAGYPVKNSLKLIKEWVPIG